VTDTAVRRRDTRVRSVAGKWRHALKISHVWRLSAGVASGALGSAEVLALLDDIGSPATVATTGGRLFGLHGGVLPAALAANWLAGVWDQNAALYVMSRRRRRLKKLCCMDRRAVWSALHLRGRFVTGTTMANFTALAQPDGIARTPRLRRRRERLVRCPPIRVVVGEEVHVSLLKRCPS